MTSDAALFSWRIVATAPASVASSVTPALAAVVMIPLPSGLVSTRSSPAAVAALVTIRPGWTTPVTARPYFGSRSFHRMAAGDDNARISRRVHAAKQDASENLLRQVLREADDVQREERDAAHGVDVAERVHHGDGAEIVGVVDDRREEVDRLNHGQVVRQAIDGSVVARVEPDEQIIVLHVGEVAQDLAEVLGAELPRSTRAGRQTGKTELFCCHAGIIDSIADGRRGRSALPLIG